MLRTEFHIVPELTQAGQQVKRIEYQESEFYRAPQRFSDFELEGMVELIVERWMTRPIGEVLDYVYFHTPPMRDVRRHQALDFSTIPSARTEHKPLNVYTLANRQKSRADLIKKGLTEWRQRLSAPQSSVLPFDTEAAEAARELDEREQTPTLHGDIDIAREDALRMPGEAG